MADTKTAVIQDLSTDGRGVAKIDGAACFVPGVFPGDRVRIEIEADSEPLSGSAIELLEPSPYRVIHPCPHADLCPASPWGRLSYEKQLEAKQKLVARTIRRAIGDVSVLPTVPSPNLWHYRGRITLTVWESDGQTQVGYQAHAREHIGVPIHTCKLADESVDALLENLETRLGAELIPNALLPRRIQLHRTAAGPGIMLVFARYPNHETIHFWERFLQPLEVRGGLWIAQGSKAGIVGHGMRVARLAGAQPMISLWMGNAIEIHPASFTQANAEAAENVHQRLLCYGENERIGTVWDLYGGYGALGFAAAGKERPVTVMEISAYSERAFAELARLARNSGSRFVKGDLVTLMPAATKSIKADDLVILDPPRSGAHPQVLGGIVQSECRRVIYLSCNVARLARDLKVLTEHGFAPAEIQSYDFFPQTPAIETLVILQR